MKQLAPSKKEVIVNNTQHNKNFISWSASSAIVVGLVAYLFSQISIIIALVLISLFTGDSSLNDDFINQPWVSLVLTGVGALVVLLILSLYLKYKKLNYTVLGLGKISQAKFWMVPLVFIVYMATTAMVIGLTSLIFTSFDVEQEQIVGYDGAAGWQLVLAFIGLVIIPPFAEELMFRGFIYQGLKNNWKNLAVVIAGLVVSPLLLVLVGPVAGSVFGLGTIISLLLAKMKPIYGAAFFTSMLFGLVHLQWNVAIDTFILSFFLIWIFEKTDNLWGSIALHALKNGLAFSLLFLFKDIISL